MVTRTPATLIDAHLRDLSDALPAARTADVEAVHGARVSTRHLREALPLAPSEAGEGARTQARDVGRALGAVRELDVLDDTLKNLEVRARFASAVLGDLRRGVAHEQREARQRMVKVIESFDPSKLRDQLLATRTSRFDRSWIPILRERIATRAEVAREAVYLAGSTYIPKCSHGARVALKKLRYAAEIAEDTGLWRPRRVRKDLRRVQGLLGDIHDRQVLVERLTREKAHTSTYIREMDWLLDLVHSDIEAQHAQFLERLPRLSDATQVCARWATGRDRAWRRTLATALPPLAASVCLIPALIGALDRRRAD